MAVNVNVGRGHRRFDGACHSARDDARGLFAVRRLNCLQDGGVGTEPEVRRGLGGEPRGSLSASARLASAACARRRDPTVAQRTRGFSPGPHTNLSRMKPTRGMLSASSGQDGSRDPARACDATRAGAGHGASSAALRDGDDTQVQGPPRQRGRGRRCSLRVGSCEQVDDGESSAPAR
jgi:hypothetical protein